jgi:hypothetical protein
LQDGDNTFQFFVGQFTSTLVQVNISLLASNVGETATHTLNGSQGNDNLVLTVNVSVEKTNDVLELETKNRVNGWHFFFFCIVVHGVENLLGSFQGRRETVKNVPKKR